MNKKLEVEREFILSVNINVSVSVIGCLPLLVQLVHAGQETPAVRRRAAQALHNLVHCHTDDKRGRREARVLRLVEQIQDYCANITSTEQCEQG